MKRGLALAAVALVAAQSPLPVHAPQVPAGARDDRSPDVASPTSAITLGTPLSLERRLHLALASSQHPGTGLVESYVPHPGLDPAFLAYLQAARPAFTYDNALAAIAWLARGDTVRAKAVLDRLVALQAGDGSLAAAFHVATLAEVEPARRTGEQMWAALALVTGYEVLGRPAYLDAAERLAAFVLPLKNPVGFGGFVLGPSSTVASTEHNVDAYALFERLAAHLPQGGQLLSHADLVNAAAYARIFVESRFDPFTGRTYTGTDAGGVATVTFPVPEDTQTWTLLALGRAKWVRGFEWMHADLWTASSAFPAVAGLGIEGPPFSTADASEVWLEGLAHAWTAAPLAGDVATAAVARDVLRALQLFAPVGDGLGLVATCAQLPTGFGFSYFDALAAAPAAWALLAAERFDPFWARSTDDPHPRAALATVSLDPPAGAVFACPSGGPCFFTVSGTSTGVVGLAVFVLVEPVNPSAGAVFTQFPAASVAPDGTWTATAQLGSVAFPAHTGDTLRVAAIVVDTTAGAVPATMSAVTPDTVPGIVTTSGVLSAVVTVGP